MRSPLSREVTKCVPLLTGFPGTDFLPSLTQRAKQICECFPVTARHSHYPVITVITVITVIILTSGGRGNYTQMETLS